ncbi:MAG: glycosyltransferase family 2 protein [Planctomycetota bacterium]|jgi:GT2 family glycosyltransferase
MDLSILIVSYNTQNLLRESLGSVYAGKNGSDFEVLVVDNHSSDGSAEMVRNDFPQARLFANGENLGFARGVNQGVRESTGRYVLILNADAVLPENGIEDLLAFADKEFENRRTGIVGVRLKNTDGSLQYSKGRFPTLMGTLTDAFRPRQHRKRTLTGYDVVSETDWVTGAAFLVRREVLDELQLLDENFFLYYEDVDLCLRARERGWRVVYYPGYEVTHANPYCRRAESREFVPVEIRRSHLYFYRKHRSPLAYSALWALTLAYTAGTYAVGGFPFSGSNGKRPSGRRVAGRIFREVLFNGHNGKALKRPTDADK